MSDSTFQFAALDARGGRVRGHLVAASEPEVAARLRAEGLTPIRIRRRGSGRSLLISRRAPARRVAEWLRTIGLLVGAGAPLASAVAMTRDQAAGSEMRRLAEVFAREIAGGVSVSAALTNTLQERASFVPGLIAAGEASSDLAGGFQQAASQIEQDANVAAEFWAALSYPAFILVATVAAILVIVLVVTPSITPLIAQGGGSAPWPLAALMGLNLVLSEFGALILVFGVLLLVLLALSVALGVAAAPLERAALDGPLRALVGALVFGRFASVLGHLLAAGVGAPEAFRLASAGTPMALARRRLDAAAAKLFEGARVAAALGSCRGMPPTIVRMAAVGEETGALGQMIAKAGDLEQQMALTALRRFAAVLGPAMIVLLGLLIGAVMAGLLSGVASLGDTVLG